jgi:predicted Zn finger-like uncharacterized protein
MPDIPRETLIQIISRFGPQICEDPKRCEALLRDLCGGFKKEISVLISSVICGVTAELRNASGSIPKKVLVERCATRLHDNTGIALDLARWGVESWAIALGLNAPGKIEFLFRCPSCNTIRYNKTSIAGKRVKCPNCNSIVCVSGNGFQFTLDPKGTVTRANVERTTAPPESKPCIDSLEPTAARPKMVLISPGSFLMGSSEADADADSNEKPCQRVIITHPYYIGETVVTQGHWKTVMGTEPWMGKGFIQENSSFPATYVSWADAVAYCKRLSDLEGQTYRLPTEAEWEYACRGGTKTKYSFGDNALELQKYGWFNDNALAKREEYAHEVKQKVANPFGLYDMHGNVWEWCSDRFQCYKVNGKPVAIETKFKSSRVLRGGCWTSRASLCRSSQRNWSDSSRRIYIVGFRIVFDLRS